MRNLIFAALVLSAGVVLLLLPAQEAASLPVSDSGTFSVVFTGVYDLYDGTEAHLAVLVEVTAGSVEVLAEAGSTEVLGVVTEGTGCVFEGEWSRVSVRGNAGGTSMGFFELRSFAGDGESLGAFTVELGTSPVCVYKSSLPAARRWLIVEADTNNQGGLAVSQTSSGPPVMCVEPGDGSGVERSTTGLWLSGTNGDKAEVEPKAPEKSDKEKWSDWVKVKQNDQNDEADDLDDPGTDNTTCYVYQVKNTGDNPITVNYKKRLDASSSTQVAFKKEVDPGDTVQFQCMISIVDVEYGEGWGGSCEWRRKPKENP